MTTERTPSADKEHAMGLKALKTYMVLGFSSGISCFIL